MTTRSTAPRTRRFATLALAALVTVASVAAEARPGGGSGIGSRGSRTYSAPAPTATAPSAPRPIERSMAQPGASVAGAATAAPARSRFGLGTGFMAGLLGAGLLGAVMGHGFFGGLAGIASLFGFLLQAGLVVGLIILAVRFFRRRAPAPAMAGAAGYARSGLEPRQPPAMGGMGMGAAPAANPKVRDGVGVTPADFDGFERALVAVQTAYGAQDVAALHRLATPEMAGYFADEIAAKAARGLVNRVTNVTLRQGDLSEAWREGTVDYATVAMRFGLDDVTVERTSGRVVEKGPAEAVELWTFRRERGAPWALSAIQQTA